MKNKFFILVVATLLVGALIIPTAFAGADNEEPGVDNQIKSQQQEGFWSQHIQYMSQGMGMMMNGFSSGNEVNGNSQQNYNNGMNGGNYGSHMGGGMMDGNGSGMHHGYQTQ